MIEAIVYKPKQAKARGSFLRLPLQKADLIAGYGIAGDAKGGHPTRQLNVMSVAAIEALAAAGFDTTPGAFGEQVRVAGLDLSRLVVGDRLRIGEAALAITGQRTSCRRLSHYQGACVDLENLPAALGVMAKVIRGGTIALGDAVDVEMAVMES